MVDAGSIDSRSSWFSRQDIDSGCTHLHPWGWGSVGSISLDLGVASGPLCWNHALPHSTYAPLPWICLLQGCSAFRGTKITDNDCCPPEGGLSLAGLLLTTTEAPSGCGGPAAGRGGTAQCDWLLRIPSAGPGDRVCNTAPQPRLGGGLARCHRLLWPHRTEPWAWHLKGIVGGGF